MTRFIPAFLVISYLFCSCRVVSTKDAKSIQALSSAIKVCANAPSEFVKQYYDQSIDVQKMKVALMPASPTLLKSMDEVVGFQRQEDILLKGYSGGYGVLTGYADLLLALTSDTATKTLKKSGDAFIAKFDTAIVKYNSYTSGTKLPVKSIGGLVSTLITELGNRRIRYLQRKYLIELVDSADKVISLICDNYAVLDHYRDSTTISIDRKDLQNTFKVFIYALQDDSGVANSYSRYKDYMPVYYNWNYKLDVLQALDQNNTAAFKKMKLSHHKLLETLHKKRLFSDFIVSVRDLYGSINAINESFKKLEKDLTPKK